jgi:hypothetical protein
VIYQEINGQRVSREGKFRLLSDKRSYGFDLASYDTRYPLIIDPVVLVYSTYLGGNTADIGLAVAVDATGNAYVAGETYSSNFPTTAGVFQTILHVDAASNAFVTKLNPTGSGPLLFSTYLGGEFSDTAWGIDIDNAGNVYVAGETTSTNFPKTNASSLSGFSDAFVTKLNTTGSALVYSTYLGGAGADAATGGIAVNRATGEAYVAGNTDSTDFPFTAGAFQTALGGVGATNAFVTKFDATGTSVDATYRGGDSSDTAWFIAVDASGNAYVTGETSSGNFPLSGPAQNTLKGAINAFVTKLNAGGTALLSSTYLGGTATDYGFGIAADSAERAYVAGYTTSTGFPTLNPYQATPALTSIGAAFVTKLQSGGGITGAISLLLLD